ncbi:MAG: lysophospholipid acyltransferase family protein [Pseudomonadota bacterium]
MSVVSLDKPGGDIASGRDKRHKKVPALYETDASKYAGPQRWQVRWWAKQVRALWHQRTYTRWVEQACESIEVVGLEHLEGLPDGCVFVANHQSHLDTLVLHEVLPKSIRRKLFYGAAQDRWFVKGRKKLALQPWYQSLALGNFPILRGGGLQALSYAHWLLARKQHVFLFPEGTRATGDSLGEFKHGASILALDNNAPIVPVYLSGLQQIRPKGQREVRKGRVKVEFLAPVTFSSGSNVEAATECIRRRMNRLHVRDAQARTSFPRAA